MEQVECTDFARTDSNTTDPSLAESITPRVRRSTSPSSSNSMYSPPHVSTSSSPMLQLPRSTVMRRTSSSLSFQVFSDLEEELSRETIESLDKEEQLNDLYYPYQKVHDNEDNIHTHHSHHHDHTQSSHSHPNHSHKSSIKPLPSLSYIFSSLPPSLKTLFTWGIIHLLLGISLWLKGQWGCGLAVTGFSYLVIFDALGVFTTFISSVLATYRTLKVSSIRNPFGVQRYEILFGFTSTIYLLFVGLYMLKEGLEHLILETSEDHFHGNSAPLPLIWILLAIGATLISAICYRNHIEFCALLKSISSNGGMHQPDAWQLNDEFFMTITNPFTITTLFCGAGVIVISILMEQNQHLGWLDNALSILEAISMFYLAGPVAVALGKILLQTTPDAAVRSLDEYLREIQLDPTILALTATHFWQNSYGQLVGTLCVHVNQDANEQAVLANVYTRLSPFFINNNGGGGELTVQIVK
ncbi:300_t:CDS:2 [Acaulospora morrowiae]|uniref:300_t:CDS:1 n=1 Tax=Acaulospora morrowiae TaxID=94023 RepID=A0A9N8WCT2_9GLOM|nr:300_t:CDS:2 [Acaulospora morrowiae]